MAIIGFKPGTVIPYVPVAERGNDKDPCTVHIKYVANPQTQDYAVRLTRATKGATSQDIAVAQSLDLQKQQFCENVVKVENYKLLDGTEVTTAAELYENADPGLIKEILVAMESVALLTKGQRKNSSGPSGSA